jgi:phosphate uptake regulator
MPTTTSPRRYDVWNRDEEIDQVYTGLFRELLTYMMEDPRTITACTHLLFMAKNIERAGDHVTNIAELGASAAPARASPSPDARAAGALHDGYGVMTWPPPAPSARDTQTSSMKPRVLIVEDETALVELLRYNLEQAALQRPRSPMTARRRWPRCRRPRPTSSCSTGCCR